MKKIKPVMAPDMAIDSTSDMWSRKVMDKETYKLICELDYSNLKVLELSGNKWRNFGFKSYKALFYPEFDICKNILREKFDLIIAEQVFEHLPYPSRAAKNINYMLKNGGYFLNTFPFLVKYHPEPNDCTRWTETGMKYFLSECGFSFAEMKSGSWGNIDCIIENAGEKWINFIEGEHSLKNDPKLPFHVWVLARKQFSFSIWLGGFLSKKKTRSKLKFMEKLRFAIFSPRKFTSKYYKILKDKA